MNAEIKERVEMIQRGEAPKGYKKTKVGIIPEDWEVKRLGDLFKFNGGYPIPRKKLGKEGICYLHYGDIHTTKNNFIDINEEKKKVPKVNINTNEIKEQYYLDDGDIVFADASEDYEGIGKSVTIINETKFPFIAGLHTIVAKDKTDLIYRDYKGYFLLNHIVRKQFMFYATGISVLGINRGNIKKLIVSLPPIKEQRKIAQILSTWDEAIELKEKLIEEKQEQKKGLMQNLLTGKVRLPGFEGEWEEVRLGEIVEKVIDNRGKTPPLSDNGEALIEVNAVEGSNKYPCYQKIKKYVSEEVYKTWFRNGHPCKEDILVATVGSVGATAIMNKNRGCIAQNLIALRIKQEYNAEFVFYWMNSSFYFNLIERVVMGAVQPSLKVPHLLQFKFKLPSLQEQKAIANILSTADREIELLKEEVELLKEQKKGLMQLLLTGIVRVKC